MKHELSRRYALACVHVFGAHMHGDDCTSLESAAHFLLQDRRISFFLQMPIIAADVKAEAFKRIMHAYALPPWIMSLFGLLLEHKRLSIVALVLLAIVDLYKRNAGIESIFITSAHELTSEQQRACDLFLSRLTQKKIMSHYAKDASLIAGIRMQGDHVLWEHSIKKQLRDLHHFFCLIGEGSES